MIILPEEWVSGFCIDHHTENDTLDKIDPAEMAQNVAAYAVLAWLAAQSPVDFGLGPGLIEAD